MWLLIVSLDGLKYYNAANKMRQPTPTASYYADYAAMLDLGFDNAPNVVYNEVEYEVTYGQEDFEVIPRVRVDTILNYNTGIILGDDYKTFIFAPEFPVQPYYGMKFRWQGSYWLVINTNSYASVPNTAEVRRCNNVLRFFNDKGEKVYEYCIIDYTLRFANNEDTMTIAVGNGEQKVWCQCNDRTMSITPNDRFLFGNPKQRVAFRLYAGGVKNYLNTVSMDDNSPRITEFYLDHYEINPLFDDYESGFANAYLNEVSVKFENLLTSLSVGESEVVEYHVYKGVTELNNIPVNITSSDDEVLSVDNNVITGHKEGNVVLTINVDGTNISTTTNIEITNNPMEDRYELIATPNQNYILQDTSQKFAVYLYKNGIQQSDAVVFNDLTTGVPHNKYEIIVDDENSFTLYNMGMYMAEPVLIKCICGKYELELPILLRGLY